MRFIGFLLEEILQREFSIRHRDTIVGYLADCSTKEASS